MKVVNNNWLKGQQKINENNIILTYIIKQHIYYFYHKVERLFS